MLAMHSTTEPAPSVSRPRRGRRPPDVSPAGADSRVGDSPATGKMEVPRPAGRGAGGQPPGHRVSAEQLRPSDSTRPVQAWSDLSRSDPSLRASTRMDPEGLLIASTVDGIAWHNSPSRRRVPRAPPCRSGYLTPAGGRISPASIPAVSPTSTSLPVEVPHACRCPPSAPMCLKPGFRLQAPTFHCIQAILVISISKMYNDFKFVLELLRFIHANARPRHTHRLFRG